MRHLTVEKTKMGQESFKKEKKELEEYQKDVEKEHTSLETKKKPDMLKVCIKCIRRKRS